MFTRMWFALLVGVIGAWGLVVRWRVAAAGERLLLWWVALGALEFMLHDVGNERRFVFLIPAFVALAAWCWRDSVLLPEAAARVSTTGAAGPARPA